MEKKWDTVIPEDLKRLFVSEACMSRWSRKGTFKGFGTGKKRNNLSRNTVRYTSTFSLFATLLFAHTCYYVTVYTLP